MDNGKMIRKMDKAKRYFQMDLNILELLWIISKKGMDNTYGKMGQFMKDNLPITRLTEKEKWNISMEDIILENIRMGKCMGKEYLL